MNNSKSLSRSPSKFFLCAGMSLLLAFGMVFSPISQAWADESSPSEEPVSSAEFEPVSSPAPTPAPAVSTPTYDSVDDTSVTEVAPVDTTNAVQGDTVDQAIPASTNEDAVSTVDEEDTTTSTTTIDSEASAASVTSQTGVEATSTDGSSADNEGSFEEEVEEGVVATLSATSFSGEPMPMAPPVITPLALVAEINATNFPDASFRNIVLTQFDTDGDGWLSDSEANAVTYMYLYNKGISDLTGLGYFTELVTIEFSGNNLSVIDFRNNKKLVEAHHAAYGETVIISAGMLSYVGCKAIPAHTGNLVVDIDGFYTTEPDGTMVVNLANVLSNIILQQITDTSSNYDPTTYILRIPAGETSFLLKAKAENYNSNDSNFFTFHTKLGAIVVHNVTFMNETDVHSKKQAVSGVKVSAPNNPTKAGHSFVGWYYDEAGTLKYDFNSPVNADLTLFALWEALNAPVPASEPVVANTSAPVAKQPVSYSTVVAPDTLPQTGDNGADVAMLFVVTLLLGCTTLAVAGRQVVKRELNHKASARYIR